MRNFKLTIDLLPKGAWGNNLSKTLSKKDWDILRECCYERAKHRCAICGYETDELDAHEVWDFDIPSKTQTLKDIIALCSRCHGVKHMRNSERTGYGENAKEHFLKVNKCQPLTFAAHYTEAQYLFDERNEVLRWKIITDLNRFGGSGIEYQQRNIPLIENPYVEVDWTDYDQVKECGISIDSNSNILAPRIRKVDVDNYEGTITVTSDEANKIEWISGNEVIKVKFNSVGKFVTKFSVEGLQGSTMFRLVGNGGETYSQEFGLIST